MLEETGWAASVVPPKSPGRWAVGPELPALLTPLGACPKAGSTESGRPHWVHGQASSPASRSLLDVFCEGERPKRRQAAPRASRKHGEVSPQRLRLQAEPHTQVCSRPPNLYDATPGSDARTRPTLPNFRLQAWARACAWGAWCGVPHARMHAAEKKWRAPLPHHPQPQPQLQPRPQRPRPQQGSWIKSR